MDTIKSYLAKLGERIRIMGVATNISPSIPSMPKSGTVTNKLENAIVKLITLDESLNEHKEIYIAFKNLPAKEYGVIFRYYINDMTAPQIAEEMHYSLRQVHRIKQNGIKIIKDVIECHPK